MDILCQGGWPGQAAGRRVQLRHGAAVSSHHQAIIGLEGVGTERVTTNLRGNAARQGEDFQLSNIEQVMR